MREPIWWNGIFFRLPGEELAKKEKRVFVAGLMAEELFRNGRRVFEVWEFVSPDEESFINYRKLNGGNPDPRSIYDGMYTHYVHRVLKELYLKGVRNYDDVKREVEKHLYDSRWLELWDMIREKKRDPEWWTRIKLQMEKLKREGYDTITAHGKPVAELVFIRTIEGSKEELCGDGKNPSILDKLVNWALYERFPEEIGNKGVEWINDMGDEIDEVKLPSLGFRGEEIVTLLIRQLG